MSLGPEKEASPALLFSFLPETILPISAEALVSDFSRKSMHPKCAAYKKTRRLF
jgi:hypothetical protein